MSKDKPTAAYQKGLLFLAPGATTVEAAAECVQRHAHVDQRVLAQVLRDVALVLEGREPPHVSAEQEIEALRREAEMAEASAKGLSPRHGYLGSWWEGRARGMRRVLDCLARYLPVSPEVH